MFIGPPRWCQFGSRKFKIEIRDDVYLHTKFHKNLSVTLKVKIVNLNMKKSAIHTLLMAGTSCGINKHSPAFTLV